MDEIHYAIGANITSDCLKYFEMFKFDLVWNKISTILVSILHNTLLSD